jgi:hypothetical protein
MIDQLFTDLVLSKPATYLAVGTSTSLPVRVITKQPDMVVGFGGGQFHTSTMLFDIRASEVPDPSAGDKITLGSHIYIVQSEPKLDREGLVWTLDVAPCT